MAKNIEKEFIDKSKLVDVDIRQEIEKNFLEYAMSVIVSRALPDLRDGLKPVHRRIVYAMNDLKINAESQHKKSARIVGEVIGKYHPHGDSSVYEAMVRMAQDFSYRYPLIDGHGNFGSIDGDGAAAMRYTEARLSKISSMLLKDIDMNIVPFTDNYDATEKEPKFLPSYFLNLLANGATGIAVGMATNIPPHNIKELNKAIIAYIKNESITIDELCKYIKAPDFPTGAMVTTGSRLESAYKTGRGSVTIKAKAHIEKIDNDKERIVITEIPYQTNKAKILEKIVELYRAKTITGLVDIRDESNYKGIRIVLELSKFTNSQIVLTKLYKFTNLQTNLSINMLALKNGIPTVLNLKEIIKNYYKHQVEMLINKIRFEQTKISNRVHILKALSVAITNIDEVINILKSAKTNEIALNQLNDKYNFDEKQAKAILDMKLQRIVGLERSKISNEIEQINQRLAEIEQILSNKDRQNELIIKQLELISEKYGDARKTDIILESQIEIEDEELIADNQMMITLSRNNYIRRLSLEDFKNQKRGGKGVIINTNAEDHIILSKIGRLKDEILFFTNKGRVYKIKAYNIPQFSRTARGIPVINYVNIQKDEKVSTIVSIKTQLTKFQYLFFITKKGIAKRVSTKEFARVNNIGKIAITLDEGDELAQVVPVTGSDCIIIGTKAGKILKIDQAAFRSMGRKTRGVKAVKLNSNDDFVVGACSDYKNEFLLTISDRGIMKKTRISEYSLIGRNSKGSYGMKINDKTGLFSMMFPVRTTDELIMISSIGKIIKIGLDEINVQGRNTAGVKGINLEKNEYLTSTTIVWNKQSKEGLKESLVEDIIIDDESQKVLFSKEPTMVIDYNKCYEDDDEL